MIKLFLALVSLFFFDSSFSQVFSGNVVEYASLKPIGYASLGILQKNEGSVANSEGHFSIDISNYSENDTLRISAIGFESQDFLIQNIVKFLIPVEFFKIELIPKTQVLNEIIVHSGKSKVIEIGNNIKPSIILAGFQNKPLGAEMGTVLKYNKKKKGRFLSLNFNFVGNRNDSSVFRVNIYEMENGLPGKNILSTPIYMEKSDKSGNISIDLSEMNIYIKADCFLSIELVDNLDFEGLFFKSAFLRSPSFHRSAPEAKWTKTSVDLGFWAEVIYKK